MVDRALFIGYNGAIAQQFGIDTLSHNIVNVNTVGYRAQRPTFSDMFNRTDKMATDSTNPIQSGHGADIAAIDTLFRQGDLKPSNSATDIAIAGNGFFVLRDPRNPDAFQTMYTRAGNFEFDAGIAESGSGTPMVLSDGTILLREHPNFTTLPRLIDPGTGRVVRGFLADINGVVNTSTVVDLTIDPTAIDPAQETTSYAARGSIEAAPPEYLLSLNKNNTGGQLSSVSGDYRGNQFRGLLTVQWSADGSGSWKFVKTGSSQPESGDFASFSADTIKRNTTLTFIPGITIRTQDVQVSAGSFTAMISPFDIKSNSSGIDIVEGAYLGNREDGTLSISTTSAGAVSWTFTPEGEEFVSESGSGTFATAESAVSTIIPGITLRKTAGTALSNGTLAVKTEHEEDLAGVVSPFFDDSSPHTQHTLITTFKQIQPNEYGVMVSAETEESFSDSSIATITGGQKRLTTYANIDQNDVSVRRTSDPFDLTMASSLVSADTANNIKPGSVRGAFWTRDLSGTIGMTVNSNGTGTWTFTPTNQTQATDQGTFTLTANTTYSQANGNEIVPGLIFTTGSAVGAGTVTLDSRIGQYNVNNNQITFSPSFSQKITSLTTFLSKYKFASDTITNAAATGTPYYTGDLRFDATGLYDTGSTIPTVTIRPNSAADTLSVAPGVTDIRQYFGPSAVEVFDYNGNLEGDLIQYDFNDQGILRGMFSNRRERNLGQIALASFRNPGGLSRAGDTSFFETVASGEATVTNIEQLPRDSVKILSKHLEYSNSAIEDDLSDLIFFQRAFQFSGRAIRAADELTQNAINLKRG